MYLSDLKCKFHWAYKNAQSISHRQRRFEKKMNLSLKPPILQKTAVENSQRRKKKKTILQERPGSGTAGKPCLFYFLYIHISCDFMDVCCGNALQEEKLFSILFHKEYYFSASQFSLLVTNWLHKSPVLRMRNVSVS